MKKYKISYDGTLIIRKGDDAVDAVKRLCRQFGWSHKMTMIDADTRGKQWAVCLIDKDGGINYNVRAVSTEI